MHAKYEKFLFICLFIIDDKKRVGREEERVKQVSLKILQIFNFSQIRKEKKKEANPHVSEGGLSKI